MSSEGQLNAASRDAALTALGTTSEPGRPPLDVLVVGGGVVGAGAALDAATRGLRVGLVEMRDFASGTSSRSSKLIHGGVRYLEMLDFALVREALRERGLMLDRLAPHLVKKVPILYPLKHRIWERLYSGAGLLLYDTIGLSPSHPRGVPMHRHLTARSVRRIAPSLKPDSYVGALQYYDAQVDDARHTLTVVRTAAAYGAHVANRTQAIEFVREGERVIGAVVKDLETGTDHTVRAKVVVNAAGVWTDEIQEMAGGKGSLKVQASKGIHLVVPRDRIRMASGFDLAHGEVGAVRRALGPALDHRHHRHPLAAGQGPTRPRRPSDIDYLLDHVNARVRATAHPATTCRVCTQGCGRCSAASPTTPPSCRASTWWRPPLPGLVLVGGGKYTTYRVMAADAIDAAVHSLGGQIAPCITDRVQLLGAAGYRGRWNQRHLLAEQSGLPVARVEHLLNRYGSRINELLDLIADDPSLAEPIHGGEDYLRVEIAYACSHEGARYLTDLLARRTRISIETWDRGLSAAPGVADLAGAVLGWDADERARQIAVYLRRVEAERASQTQLDDITANTARLMAREPVVDVRPPYVS